MNTTGEQHIVDDHDNRMAVVLDLDRYRELLEAAEEVEAVRAFDDAKSSADESIPFSSPTKTSRNRTQRG